MQTIIHANNISMCFNLHREKVDNFKEYFIRAIRKQLSYDMFWALHDVSFSMRQGESLAIIGPNGSGKSTMLKIIAGVLKPTHGNVSVKGVIAPLIELGAGFDSDLTANENIFLNGAVLGYSKNKMRELKEEIIEFSELRDFMDVPVKNFSSGMMARLGFAIATAITPDILIVDEILGVGDFKFQKKCEERIKKIIDSGTSVLLVSHNKAQVLKICQKAIWIDKGALIMSGDAKDVCAEYSKS